MKDLTNKELMIIYNLTKEWLKENQDPRPGKTSVLELHYKADKELSRRGVWL